MSEVKLFLAKDTIENTLATTGGLHMQHQPSKRGHYYRRESYKYLLYDKSD